jgi:hypothetical protein
MQISGVAVYLLQIFVSVFLAILFLQSGIDKIADRQGNLEWLKGHFAKSLLAGMVPLLLGIITILEVLAGVLSGIGFLALTAQLHPRPLSSRSFLDSEWQKSMPVRRCWFHIFCLPSSRFICSGIDLRSGG